MDVLQEPGAHLPHFVDLRSEHDISVDCYLFAADFNHWDNRRSRVRWCLDRRTLEDFSDVFRSSGVGLYDTLRREYVRIWERCCDRQHTTEYRALITPARRELEAAVAIATTPEQMRAAYEAFEAAERRAQARSNRRLEREPLSMLTGPARNNRAFRRDRPGDFFSNVQVDRRLSGPTPDQIQAAVAQLNVIMRLRVTRQEFNEQAEKRGLELLRSWLTPEQDEQYADSKAFEVIGSDTGTRYRIRYGQQMNIDELSEDGGVHCGWCFVPKGSLVPGDVMLAQKIALETFETDVLKEANRFPIDRGQFAGLRASSLMWGMQQPPGVDNRALAQQAQAMQAQYAMQAQMQASMLGNPLSGLGTATAQAESDRRFLTAHMYGTPMVTTNGFVSMVPTA